MTQTDETLFGDGPPAEGSEFGRHSTGILPSHVLRRLIRARREIVAMEEFDKAQLQPTVIFSSCTPNL